MGIKLEIVKTGAEIATEQLLKQTEIDEQFQNQLEETFNFKVDDINEQFAQVQLPISAIGLVIDLYKVMKNHMLKENKKTQTRER